MIFECKVYNSKGDLVKVHTRKELEERSKNTCMDFLPGKERAIIESFGDFKRGEDDSEVIIYTYYDNRKG